MKGFTVTLFFLALQTFESYANTMFDASRNRNIPVDILSPLQIKECHESAKCEVVFISAGYGVSYKGYKFLSNQFQKLGYLVVSVGHELPNDPSLSTSGDLYKTRSENWARGAQTLQFLRKQLSTKYRKFDFENLTLVGHSNGGDISAWLGNLETGYVKSIITLDHRRVPLPKSSNIKVLSIRATDFPADVGVLPNEAEQELYGSCVVNIPHSKHNDLVDNGPEWLKRKVQTLINGYVKELDCSKLKEA